MKSKRVIWKQELRAGLMAYEMPRGAQFLSAAIQRDVGQIWFLCDPDAPRETRFLLVVGTGHEFDLGERPERWRFVATMFTEDKGLVFHVLESSP